jgi:hypothetical protein
MGAAHPKDGLLQELTTQRDRILAVCDGMSEAERTTPFTPEGWNAQDFVGHLSDSEQLTLQHIGETFKQGQPTPVPFDILVDDLNARARAQRAAWSWPRVRAEFVHTRGALIQRVQALTESDLEFQLPSPWHNDTRIISLETFIREDVLRHGQEHLAELENLRNENH